MDENKSNQKLFDQYREIWLAAKTNNIVDIYDYKSAFKKFADKIENKPNEIPKNRFIRNFQISFARIAAIIVIAFIIGFVFQSVIKKTNSNLSLYQEITVPLGSKSKIRLPDGTHVVLNAGSKLRYQLDYGTNQRVVNLEGEGYFDVAKDKKHPFIVKTEFIDVKALGTSFNVKAYSADNKVEATLVEGSVEIQHTKIKNARDNGKEIIILKPHQRYTYIKEEVKHVKKNTPMENIAEEKNKPIDKLESVTAKKVYISENFDIKQDISWKDKRWVIYREQLDELAVKLGRRYDVSILFDDEDLKNYSFTGTLEDESLEQVMKVISLSSPVLYEIKGKTVIFRKNKEYLKKYKELFQAEK